MGQKREREESYLILRTSQLVTEWRTRKDRDPASKETQVFFGCTTVTALMLLLPPAARSATALSARCCYRRGTTALSALGEGVVPFSSETTPLSAAMEPAAFFALSALAAVALAFVLANYFEPNPNAREALFGGGDGAGVGNVRRSQCLA